MNVLGPIRHMTNEIAQFFNTEILSDLIKTLWSGYPLKHFKQ